MSARVVFAGIVLAGVASAGELNEGAAFARWTESRLEVGTARFRAELAWSSGLLRVVSLKSADGVERLRGEPAAGEPISVEQAEVPWSVAGVRELALKVVASGRSAEVRVWPEANGPLVFNPAGDGLPERPDDRQWSPQVFRAGWNALGRLTPCGDVLRFAAANLKVRAVTALDRTDVHAELLPGREWLMPSCEVDGRVSCSQLDAREQGTGRGVVFVRLAPMPVSRPTDAEDFCVEPSTRSVLAVANGYPLAVLAYEGGETGRLRALRDFQRSLWPYRPGRDGLLLSNTWGDGNRDSRISESFLLGEIAAASDIGVEVVQIDDGWQKGRTKNSALARAAKDGNRGVWNGYWAADPDFWKPHPERFPRGFGPLLDAAKAGGVTLGLWYGPDSTDDCVNWERDADCLLGYLRDCGIPFFKIDSLKLRTPKAFARNRAFFGKMLTESQGRMAFDLDCTAEIRPGYFGGMPVGPLFVENRYAFRAGDQRIYRPHQTLRTLWSLAHVIDPVRLRMEFLNPAKKADLYGDDPLAPSRWPADALFAITMMASPLAWMELSDVPEEVRAAWRPLIAAWKRHRPALHGGLVVPVGEAPDGEAWTGFVSSQSASAYVLLFREANSSPRYRLPSDALPFVPNTVQVLGGRGTARVREGELEVEVGRSLDFAWLLVSR